MYVRELNGEGLNFNIHRDKKRQIGYVFIVHVTLRVCFMYVGCKWLLRGPYMPFICVHLAKSLTSVRELTFGASAPYDGSQVGNVSKLSAC